MNSSALLTLLFVIRVCCGPAWISDDYPDGCQYGPWSDRFKQHPEGIHASPAKGNASTNAVAAEFAIVGSPHVTREIREHW
jgi:hypothetical protein